MNNLLIYTILVLFTAFIESIAQSAGIISFAMIISLLVVENNRTWLSVAFISILSLILDSFYFNIIGTFYLAAISTALIHLLLKKVLPYENIILRIPVLLISFMLFHILIFYITKIEGHGSSMQPDLLNFFVRSIFEMILFAVLSVVLERFYNKSVNSERIQF